MTPGRISSTCENCGRPVAGDDGATIYKLVLPYGITLQEVSAMGWHEASKRGVRWEVVCAWCNFHDLCP